MTDGLTGMTLEQINEALKNSFTGIKRDMDFLRKSIVSQEERFNETLKSIKTTLHRQKNRTKTICWPVLRILAPVSTH